MGLPSEAILDRLAHMTPAETDTLAKYLRAEGGQRGRSAASERTTRRRERPVDGRVDRVVERGV
jgi:hypothetical protein